MAPKRKMDRVPAWSRYRKLRVVGAGAFGQVFLVEKVAAAPTDNNAAASPTAGKKPPKSPSSKPSKAQQKPPEVFVLKRIFMQGSDDMLQSAAVEIRVLEALERHANVVSFREHFVDDEGYINVVVECCPFGDLEALIRARKEANRPFSVKEVLFLAFQLLCAVRHLHAHGVMHRDIKPGNLLLTSFDQSEVAAALTRLTNEGAGPDGDAPIGLPPLPGMMQDCSNCCLKIADFGIAKVLQETHGKASTVIGTPHYLSPEICNAEPYTNSADLWAVGCVVHEIASRSLDKLFGGDNMMVIVQKICKAEIPSTGSLQLDTAVLPLVKSLVAGNPSDRLSAAAAISTFFQPAAGDDEWEDDFEDPDEFEGN